MTTMVRNNAVDVNPHPLDPFPIKTTLAMYDHANGFKVPIFCRRFLQFIGKNNMWITMHDLCGITCSLLGLSIIFFTNYMVVQQSLVPMFNWSMLGIIHFIIYEIIVTMCLLTLIKTMTTQPGLVPVSGELSVAGMRLCQQRNVKVCLKCFSRKPYRAHHCSICNAW